MCKPVTPHEVAKGFVKFIYEYMDPIELALTLDSAIFKIVRYQVTDPDFEPDVRKMDDIGTLKELRDICLGISKEYNHKSINH